MVDFLSSGLLPHCHKMLSKTSVIISLLNCSQDRKTGHVSLLISFNQEVVIHKSLPNPSSLPPDSHWPDWVSMPTFEPITSKDGQDYLGWLRLTMFRLLAPKPGPLLEHVVPCQQNQGSTV